MSTAEIGCAHERQKNEQKRSTQATTSDAHVTYSTKRVFAYP
jgi:hypothetical protein